MSLVIRKPRNQEKTYDERIEHELIAEEAFRHKIAIQQFMNHNGPLFRAFARSGTSIEEMVQGEVLRKPASQAMELALLIASRVLGRPGSDLAARDIAPFRSEAAEYVASRFTSGSIDIARAAEEIAEAIKLADGSWDHDVYRDDKLSDDASLMISAVSGAGQLAEMVNVYDFRQGRDVAFATIGREVVETAAKTADEMLPDARTPADIRNLTQTLVRNLSRLMSACYDRKAREVTSFLKGKTEPEIRKWYDQNSPLDDVIKDFKSWTVCFAGYAMTASKEMKMQKNIVEKKQDNYSS